MGCGCPQRRALPWERFKSSLPRRGLPTHTHTPGKSLTKGSQPLCLPPPAEPLTQIRAVCVVERKLQSPRGDAGLGWVPLVGCVTDVLPATHGAFEAAGEGSPQSRCLLIAWRGRASSPPPFDGAPPAPAHRGKASQEGPVDPKGAAAGREGSPFLGFERWLQQSALSRRGFHGQELSGTDPVHKPFGIRRNPFQGRNLFSTARCVLGWAEKNWEEPFCVWRKTHHTGFHLNNPSNHTQNHRHLDSHIG